MKTIKQSLPDIADSLTEMESAWQDETALRIIELIKSVPPRSEYGANDVVALLNEDFENALTVIRLFLDLSKDRFQTLLDAAFKKGGSGVKRFKKDPDAYVAELVSLGLLERMTSTVNTPLIWSDLLVERLKGGRGRAISGQKRGRSLEDFVEALIVEAFGEKMYEMRCSFVGKDGVSTAKADFAIPFRQAPSIVIEAKGYGATGSKQTDVLGDLARIVNVKRNDTTLLFVTDGLTWRRRMNDLRNIVGMQNNGEITRIYTRSMADEMLADLRTLGTEYGL
jgi:hypothetical protein